MIRRAKRADLAQINQLLNTYGLSTIDRSFVNHRDVALVAEIDGKVVGFVWAGLMRQNKTAYIDYFTVSKELSKQGVGHTLARETLTLFNKLGVERAFGVIERDEFHDKSAFNALKMGMYAQERPYTYVYGFIPHSCKELRIGE
jgi:N-acetylglutamate synthase-like GNAT family acetyltransferase